jgi:hypothetical protein
MSAVQPYGADLAAVDEAGTAVEMSSGPLLMLCPSERKFVAIEAASEKMLKDSLVFRDSVGCEYGPYYPPPRAKWFLSVAQGTC